MSGSGEQSPSQRPSSLGLLSGIDSSGGSSSSQDPPPSPGRPSLSGERLEQYVSSVAPSPADPDAQLHANTCVGSNPSDGGMETHLDDLGHVDLDSTAEGLEDFLRSHQDSESGSQDAPVSASAAATASASGHDHHPSHHPRPHSTPLYGETAAQPMRPHSHLPPAHFQPNHHHFYHHANHSHSLPAGAFDTHFDLCANCAPELSLNIHGDDSSIIDNPLAMVHTSGSGARRVRHFADDGVSFGPIFTLYLYCQGWT